MLNAYQLDEYDKNGVIVIKNVFTDEEVDQIRKDLHDQLLTLGIDHDKVLSGEQKLDDGVRIKGKPSRIFYNKWKMDVHLNDKVYNYVKNLMTHTYSSGKKKGYEHPMGYSNDVLAYIDRICWRLPDSIKAEGGLNMHLDRNPYSPYDNLKKWRPIQAFVSLTDQFGSSSGGLKVVKGFHNRIDEFFAKSTDETLKSQNGGEFFRMNSKSFAALEKELQPINAPKGSLVLWDNRLPHATCDKLDGFDTREVVYVGWLPNVKINREYCDRQLDNIKQNVPPPAYVNDKDEKSDRNWTLDDLSHSQKHMLGIK